MVEILSASSVGLIVTTAVTIQDAAGFPSPAVADTSSCHCLRRRFGHEHRHPHPLDEARAIADDVITQLSPHCSKLQIAGSIRRRRPTIGDIEIVCLPHAYEASPLFPTGIATVVNQWQKIKGELPCRYTQRLLPCGLKLDLFMPDPLGYGVQVAVRTGSATWCQKVLAPAWVRAGFRSKEGVLRRDDGEVVPVYTERDLFDLIGLKWVKPEDREV